MAVDKKLWKALRAGGLGHAAATLLADKATSAYIGARDYSDDGWVTEFLVHDGANPVVRDRQPFDFVGTQEISIVGYPMAVGAVLDIYHSRWDEGWTNETICDLFVLDMAFQKLADANGIPVASVVTGSQRARAAGAWSGSTPASPASFTITYPAPDNVHLVCATAGFYNIRLQAVIT